MLAVKPTGNVSYRWYSPVLLIDAADIHAEFCGGPVHVDAFCAWCSCCGWLVCRIVTCAGERLVNISES